MARKVLFCLSVDRVDRKVEQVEITFLFYVFILEVGMESEEGDLRERTKQFALRFIRMFTGLPKKQRPKY
jgi:hypothetical protein